MKAPSGTRIRAAVLALAGALAWGGMAFAQPPLPGAPAAPPPPAFEDPGLVMPAPAPLDAAPATAAAPAEEAAAGAVEMIPTKNLLEVAKSGGPVMIPIGFCSFLLVVFSLERLVSLRRSRIIPRPFVKRFLQQLRERQLDRESALLLCEENSSPAAQVFAGAVRKWGRASVEVEQGMLDAGERAAGGLRRYLRVLNGVSQVAPLLGLLGTVTGMINSFNVIASADAMGRPQLLASGISEALITTAAGLFVAIPALVAYLFFVSRVDRLVTELDGLGQEVVGLVSSDGWEHEPAEKSKPKARPKGPSAA